MILLQLSGVAKSFGDQAVLHDVDLTLQKGDCVGLVGANGSGKSTLLKIMAGQWETTAGRCDRPQGIRVGYLPQSARVSGDLTLFAEMERVFAGRPETEPYEYKIRRTLHGVGLPESFWKQSTSLLSGGETCRAALARVILTEPDVLLLDEPTNHLDLAGREWLESYLSRFEGAVVIVAHDRVLLNRCTNRTGFLLARTLKTYAGNYEKSRAEWEAERERAQVAFERQQEFVARTEDFIQRNIAGQKSRQAQSRRKMLARLARVKRPESESAGPSFGWEHAGRSRAELVRFERCVIGYDGQELARIDSLVLRRGERVGVVGPNGCGKSTLIRTVLGEIVPRGGVVQVAEGTRTTYFRQELGEITEDVSVEQHFWNAVPDWQIGQVRSHLARFLFRRDDVEKNLRGLSGGERRRLELARLTVEPAHLLVLDEPTNHLDLMAQDAIEEALSGFEGALMLVSHDRWLLDAVCDKLWVFEHGTLREFLGSYADYAARRDALAAQPAVSGPAKARPRSKESIERERKREKLSLERQVAEAEAAIARLETELAGIEAEGRDPKTATNWERLNFLATEKRKRHRDLSRWLTAWEEASSRLHEFKGED